MTLEDTANEYIDFCNRDDSDNWESDERAIIYLAHCINQLNGTFIILEKQLRKINKGGKI